MPPDARAPDLQPWLRRWALTAEAPAFTTPFGSRLQAVRRGGAAAMLKLAGGPEERDGAALMEWWAGDGAARVLAREGEALLLERASGDGALAGLVRAGRDEEACAILCALARRLHAPRRSPPPPSLVPLERWFRALWPSAQARGGVLVRCAGLARALLDSQAPPAALHGDLHHDNVLDFGPRGWLAIDPKGLWGDPGFDFANLFCNPWPEAAEPGRLEARLAIVARESGAPAERLLAWLAAYAGLSASWTLDAGGDAGPALLIAERASALLG
jgi:streptomycin 6-kinase